MSTTESEVTISLVAGADLSNSQYRFVSLDNLGRAVVTGAGGSAIGVLSKPGNSGQDVTVVIEGVTKIKGYVSQDAGALVSSTVDGRATEPGEGDFILGRLLEDSAENRVVSMIFQKEGAVPAS